MSMIICLMKENFPKTIESQKLSSDKKVKPKKESHFVVTSIDKFKSPPKSSVKNLVKPKPKKTLSPQKNNFFKNENLNQQKINVRATVSPEKVTKKLIKEGKGKRTKVKSAEKLPLNQDKEDLGSNINPKALLIENKQEKELMRNEKSSKSSVKRIPIRTSKFSSQTKSPSRNNKVSRKSQEKSKKPLKSSNVQKTKKIPKSPFSNEMINAQNLAKEKNEYLKSLSLEIRLNNALRYTSNKKKQNNFPWAYDQSKAKPKLLADKLLNTYPHLGSELEKDGQLQSKPVLSRKENEIQRRIQLGLGFLGNPNERNITKALLSLSF